MTYYVDDEPPVGWDEEPHAANPYHPDSGCTECYPPKCLGVPHECWVCRDLWHHDTCDEEGCTGVKFRTCPMHEGEEDTPWYADGRRPLGVPE